MLHYFDKISAGSQAVYPPGATFGDRMSHDFEFVWIDQGDVIWQCNGEDINCPPGTLLLVRPGMRDAFTWDPLKQTRHSFVHFSLGHQFEESFPHYADYNTWPKSLTLPETNIVFPLFDHLRYLQSQPEVNHDLVQHCLLQILLSFINNQCRLMDDAVNDLHPAIQRVFTYLQTVWSNTSMPMPSMQDLVNAAGVSEVHLGRIFRDSFGTSPSKAIRALRMERAAKYLIRTNMRVQEISDILGCENPYQFSRSFKSVHSKSPREYRQYFREHPYEALLSQNLPWSGNILTKMPAVSNQSTPSTD